MSRRSHAKRFSRPRLRFAVISLSVLVILVVLFVWARLKSDAPVGVPLLAVDRTEVDLGYQQFETPARVTFTLTNVGDRPLRLSQVPLVKAAAGC
jgi:hypothetical protein